MKAPDLFPVGEAKPRQPVAQGARVTRAAVCAAYADTARSLRAVGGEFGLTKTQVYSIILADAPHLLGRTKGAKKRLDPAEVKRLTLAGKSRAEIGAELGFGYDAVWDAQVKLGLHKAKPRPKPKPRGYEVEAPCGKQIGRWPPGVWFTSLQMKPMRARAPRTGETQSLIGNSAALCAI